MQLHAYIWQRRRHWLGIIEEVCVVPKESPGMWVRWIAGRECISAGYLEWISENANWEIITAEQAMIKLLEE